MRPDDQPTDPTQNYSPADLTITDPAGNPLPDNHPMVVNPQFGRPVSKGDLSLPENQELADALANQPRREVRAAYGSPGPTTVAETAPMPTPARGQTTPPPPAPPQTPTQPAPAPSQPSSPAPSGPENTPQPSSQGMER